MIYSGIYLLLAAIDLAAMFTTMRKLNSYDKLRIMDPEAPIKINGLGCIKWVSVVTIVFYSFITLTFFMTLPHFQGPVLSASKNMN